MDVICVYFCLIETKYYRIATSVSLGRFEVSKWSCPLKSFSEENTGRRPKLSRRKGGDRPGLTTATHCLHRPLSSGSVQNHISRTGFWKTLNLESEEARETRASHCWSTIHRERLLCLCSIQAFTKHIATCCWVISPGAVIHTQDKQTRGGKDSLWFMIQRVPCFGKCGEAESHVSLHSGGGCSSLGSLGLKEKEEARAPLSHLRTNSR